MEGVVVRDYVSDDLACNAYGILGIVNGFGVLLSSRLVELQWSAGSAEYGFRCGAVITLDETIPMWRV